MLYQINSEKNQWVYETKTKEFDQIEVEFEIDPMETDNEPIEITIYAVSLVKTDPPCFGMDAPSHHSTECVIYGAGAIHRMDVFKFVNRETIEKIASEIKAQLVRKKWNDIFR